LPEIFVDADACPVKEETYRVAKRYGLTVRLVSNRWIRIPSEPWLHLVVVKDDALDTADDWIVEEVAELDIVITQDIPLASRCLEKGARVLSPRGRPFTEDSIGEALAMRELTANLREAGTLTGGPPPMDKRARSRFLQRLDEIVNAVLREKRADRDRSARS
jgi:uncharacterized protein YaiI (UPF0178 family)